MFLKGNFNLVDYVQGKTTAFKGRPYILTHVLADSPTGLILSKADLDYDSWIWVLFCSAKIASIVPATDLTIPKCATREHHCCPAPTCEEKRFSPQCQQLFNQSTMILLLGLLFAPETSSWFGLYADSHLLRLALAIVEHMFPTAIRHAKRLKQKVERRISESGVDSEDKFLQWKFRLTDLFDEVMRRGFVMEYRD